MEVGNRSGGGLGVCSPPMLKTLKDLFDGLLSPAQQAESPAHVQHRLQLAAAVLLVEVMRADTAFEASERRAVVAALQGKFGLAEDETARLLELAQQASREASDYFAFTSRINDGFDMERKLVMIEQMWRVAYADGVLNAHENHLMRKIADLLYIPQGAYVHAKMRAQQAAGLA
jgi:uncharacterized tellurite resistance protein B-like protein